MADGNIATMREAIVIIRDMLINGGHDAQCRAKIVTICNTVLSTPTRNCDVGTVAEQYKRFRDYCYTQKCPSITKENTFSQIAFAWAQMPYEAEGDDHA